MKRLPRIFASISLAIIFLSIIIWYTGPQAFWQNLHAIPLWLLFPLYILFTVLWFIKGMRWNFLLRQHGYALPMATATSLSLLGNYSNLLIPAKLGDGLWMYTANKRHKIKMSIAVTTVLLDRFYDLLTVTLFALTSMLLLLWIDFPMWVYYTLAIGFSCIVILLFGAFSLIHYKKMFMNIIKHKRLANIIDMEANIINQAAHSNGILRIIGLSLIIWFIQTTMCYLIASFLSHNISFAVIAFAVALANMTLVVPITPSNIGIYESVFVGVLLLVGVGKDISLSIGLIDHLVKVLYVAVAGSIVSANYSTGGLGSHDR